MRLRQIMCLVGASLFLGACAGIDPNLNGHSPALYGWNIGAVGLLDAGGPTAHCRLAVYLDEIVTAGYQRQIRIIYTPDFGPFILQHWIPVIRQHQFRVLVILSQSQQDSDPVAQVAWMRQGLPPILDILDGVQLRNEPDQKSDPYEYARWHRTLLSELRLLLPAVPVVGPDIFGGSAGWLAQTGLIYGRDYDVVSLHAQRETTEEGLQRQYRDAALAIHPQPRVWVTEGDWGQTPWFNANGLPIERTYVYVWNGNELETRRPKGHHVPC